MKQIHTATKAAQVCHDLSVVHVLIIIIDGVDIALKYSQTKRIFSTMPENNLS